MVRQDLSPTRVKALFAVFLLHSIPLAAEARVIEEMLHSPALENNLLGDSAERAVLVYLPPSYDDSPEKTYPVLYLFHGGGVNNKAWIENSYLDGYYVEPVMERLLSNGEILEMIVVMPDAFPYASDRYVFSFYTNTPVLGDYDDYLARDLVAHIDNNYRTIPHPEGRGISGHSLGGYGAVYLAIEHPEVFSIVYGQDASALDFDVFTEFNIEATNRKAVEIIGSQDISQLEKADFLTKAVFSAAVSFSPNLDSPFLADLPWEEIDGELRLIEPIWRKWVALHRYLVRMCRTGERETASR